MCLTNNLALFRPVYLLATLVLAILVPAPGTSAQVKILPVALQWQETPEWCWAASGQMLMNSLGPRNVPQCYEANQEFGRSDCCECPTPPACVSPGWPQFSTWNYNSNSTNWGTALSWNAAMAEINSGRPFLFSWAWNGGGGHALAANGYLNIKFLGLSLNWIYVDNPWPPQGRCGPGGNASGPFGGDMEIDTYADFVGGPGFDHTHGADIYNISYK